MSVRNVGSAEAVIPVRRRLMNAVFFFKAESRDLLTGKTSVVENLLGCEHDKSPKMKGGAIVIPVSSAQALAFSSRSSPVKAKVSGHDCEIERP